MKIIHKSLCDYQQTFTAMQQFTCERTSNTEDEIWLLEHHSVYTQGVAGKPDYVLPNINSQIPIIQTDRGGQITYHGPGQLTGYLLIDLKRHQLNTREFVVAIEQSLIEILSHWNIPTIARNDAPGVYINHANSSLNGAKIAALGLRIKRGCSYHGFNLNIDMDMAPWHGINPCGLNTPVTQMKDYLSAAKPKNLIPSFESVAQKSAEILTNKFDQVYSL